MSNNLQLSHQDTFIIKMSKIAKLMGIQVTDQEIYGTDFSNSWINQK